MKPETSFSAEIIEAEYQRRGLTMGWRLLTCPERNIQTAKVALITINPGGIAFENSKWSVEDGSAYVIEKWRHSSSPGQAPLQQQITRMFEIMNVLPQEVLSGYLVPFRSQTWNQLPDRKSAKEFGKNLWRNILCQTSLRIVIAFGKDIGPDVAELLETQGLQEFPAGWGEQTIDIFQYGTHGKLIVLPHLSRFSLFNRQKSEESFRQAAFCTEQIKR